LLKLVVANERRDLEESYNDNSKETFDHIKNLKEIENSILTNLLIDVERILSDEQLINTLADSSRTAELIAAKMKKINSTNQFL